MTDTYVSPDALIADAMRPDDAPDPEFADMLDRVRSEPWEITGRRSAEWCIARARQAQEECAAATEPARVQIEALQARIDVLTEFIAKEETRRDHDVAFFTGHLTAWLRKLRRKDLDDGIDPDKATKSIRLAGGSVTSRAGRDRVEIDDGNILCGWAFGHDDVPGVRGIAEAVPKVDQRKLRAYIKATGEVPPGVTLTPAAEDDRSYGVDIK